MSVLDQFRIEGRRAIVTGGSRGLGLEMARGLRDAGAEVVIVSRDRAHLDRAAEELAQSGAPVHTMAGDLASAEGATQFCGEALKRWPQIDILVNNVGGRRINVPTEDLPTDEWQKIIELNLTQAFVCTKLIGGPMLERGWGRVINVSSISGMVAVRPMRGRSYETSKAALTMFTRAVAADWAPRRVTVNAIAPGPFLTDANRRWFGERPELQRETEDAIPMGRMGDPREVAALAVYLASEASSYMTGATLVLDGGRTLW